MNDTAFLLEVERLRPLVKELSVQELYVIQGRYKKVYLVDIRDNQAWLKGHIPGAASVNPAVLQQSIEGLIPDKSAHVILYCQRGHRSVIAAHRLQTLNYVSVYSLSGGYEAWRATL